MTTRVTIHGIFRCSLERAFKTPMLCDITKVHTGYGPMPRVTHTSDDAHWGKPGHSKKVHVSKTFFQKGGFQSTDTVIERIENEYWKIEVGNFQSWMFGFEKFVGEWKTTQQLPNEILVEYTYTMHTGHWFFYPLNWLIAKTIWPVYMRQVRDNIRQMAYDKEPYLFD